MEKRAKSAVIHKTTADDFIKYLIEVIHKQGNYSRHTPICEAVIKNVPFDKCSCGLENLREEIAAMVLGG